MERITFRQGQGGIVGLRRKLVSVGMEAAVFLCTLMGVVALVSVLGYVTVNGIPAINLDFFTNLPKPVGETGGGMANAIVGTLMLLVLASAIGLPVGILAGIYLAEFGDNALGTVVRFVTDIFTGIPTIAIGIFVYTLVVLPMRSFSALAGGIALGIIMIPTVTRTTEEMLRLVPHSLREAGLALGIPQWRTTLSIVLPSAAGGILTGIMLAIARAGGETAPLLFTAFGNRFWSIAPDKPVAAMTLQIFNYAISPYDDWHAQAWAGSLVLVAIILVLSVAARFFASRRSFT
ncbi:MAG: phosphate ABC transporter permease PstA [Dehalococcoidia bacterium]|nr:phosphate ABC transporter permease PstA [Dehalococcoidia bacterium]